MSRVEDAYHTTFHSQEDEDDGRIIRFSMLRRLVINIINSPWYYPGYTTLVLCTPMIAFVCRELVYYLTLVGIPTSFAFMCLLPSTCKRKWTQIVSFLQDVLDILDLHVPPKIEKSDGYDADDTMEYDLPVSAHEGVSNNLRMSDRNQDQETITQARFLRRNADKASGPFEKRRIRLLNDHHSRGSLIEYMNNGIEPCSSTIVGNRIHVEPVSPSASINVEEFYSPSEHHRGRSRIPRNIFEIPPEQVCSTQPVSSFHKIDDLEALPAIKNKNGKERPSIFDENLSSQTNVTNPFENNENLSKFYRPSVGSASAHLTQQLKRRSEYNEVMIPRSSQISAKEDTDKETNPLNVYPKIYNNTKGPRTVRAVRSNRSLGLCEPSSNADFLKKQSNMELLQDSNIRHSNTFLLERTNQTIQGDGNKGSKHDVHHHGLFQKPIVKPASELPPVLRRQSTSPIKKPSMERRSRLHHTSSPLKASSSRLSEAIEQQFADMEDSLYDLK